MSDELISPVESVGATEAVLPVEPIVKEKSEQYEFGRLFSKVDFSQHAPGSIIYEVHAAFHSINFSDDESEKKINSFYQPSKSEQAKSSSYESKKEYAEKLMGHMSNHGKTSLKEHLEAFKSANSQNQMGSWANCLHTTLITQQISQISLMSSTSSDIFEEDQEPLEEKPLFVTNSSEEGDEDEEEQQDEENSSQNDPQQLSEPNNAEKKQQEKTIENKAIEAQMEGEAGIVDAVKIKKPRKTKKTAEEQEPLSIQTDEQIVTQDSQKQTDKEAVSNNLEPPENSSTNKKPTEESDNSEQSNRDEGEAENNEVSEQENEEQREANHSNTEEENLNFSEEELLEMFNPENLKKLQEDFRSRFESGELTDEEKFMLEELQKQLPPQGNYSKEAKNPNILSTKKMQKLSSPENK